VSAFGETIWKLMAEKPDTVVGLARRYYDKNWPNKGQRSAVAKACYRLMKERRALSVDFETRREWSARPRRSQP